MTRVNCLALLLLLVLTSLSSVAAVDALPDASSCAAGLNECLNFGTVSKDVCVETIARDVCVADAVTICNCPGYHVGKNCQIPQELMGCRTGEFFTRDPFTKQGVQQFECKFDTETDESSHVPLPLDALMKRELHDHVFVINTDWRNSTISFQLQSRLIDPMPYVDAARSWWGIGAFLNKVKPVPNCGKVVEVVSCHATACQRQGTQATCQTMTCKYFDGQITQFKPLFDALHDNMNKFTLNIVDDTINVLNLFSISSCDIGACFMSPIPPATLGVVMPLFAAVLFFFVVGAVILVHLEVFRPPVAIRDSLAGKSSASSNEAGAPKGSGRDQSGSRTSSGTIKTTASAATTTTTPIGLAWRNLTFSLPSPISRFRRGASIPGHVILKEAAGIVRPGELVAIMGPSGAGKSTLLDLLGGMSKMGTAVGQVCLTGTYCKEFPMNQLLAYVVQTDYNLSAMTVWETLQFSARTRLSRTLCHEEILERVVHTLDLVGLSHVATSIVGTPETGGISGGERRRLAVGVELIAEPRVLLLDEITSGLDSFYASSILRVLRRAATETGMAIVLTIHQPPASLFPLFDRLILMGYGGHTVYQGAPTQSLDFMRANCPEAAPFLKGTNPFEYLINNLKDVDNLVNLYRGSASFADMMGEIDLAIADACAPTPSDLECGGEGKVADFVPRDQLTLFQQTLLLTKRSFQVVARDPTILILYNMITVGIAIMSGLIFYNLDLGVSGSQNRIGFVFCSILFGALLSMTSIDLFVSERILYDRESRAGCYSSLPYFIAKLLVDLVPFRIIPALLFASISYYMVGLQGDILHFSTYLGVLVLCNAVAGASIFAISTAAADVRSANLVGVCYFIFNIVFGGPFLAQRAPEEDGSASGSGSSVFLSKLSFFYYAFESLVSNEFTGLNILFDADLTAPPPAVSEQVYPLDFNVKKQSLIPMTGTAFLKMMNWNASSLFNNICVLLSILIAFYVISFLALKFARKRSSK